MIPYQYAYMFGCLLFFIPWGILFWRRKDLRYMMLVMGAIGAVVSLITARYWTVDWWSPQTVTGTRVGIEDFILGFTNAGIATALYIEVFKKRLYHHRKSDHSRGLGILAVTTCVLFYVLFHLFHLTSFYACAISLSAFSVVMLWRRPDLLISSIANGALMVLVAIPIYFLEILFSPGIVDNTYVYGTLSGIRFLGIPAEELIFYFIFGVMVALMNEYWHGLKIRNASKKRFIN